jgi:hypothetical protein
MKKLLLLSVFALGLNFSNAQIILELDTVVASFDMKFNHLGKLLIDPAADIVYTNLNNASYFNGNAVQVQDLRGQSINNPAGIGLIYIETHEVDHIEVTIKSGQTYYVYQVLEIVGGNINSLSWYFSVK